MITFIVVDLFSSIYLYASSYCSNEKVNIVNSGNSKESTMPEELTLYTPISQLHYNS